MSLHQLASLALLAVDEKKTALEKMDPLTRAKILSALGALVILGLLLMALTWLGGRMTRKYINREPDIREPDRQRAPHEDDWASKPLPKQDTD